MCIITSRLLEGGVEMTHAAQYRKPAIRQYRDSIAVLRAQVDTKRSSLLSVLPDFAIVSAFDSMPAKLQRYFFQCGPGEALRLLLTFVEPADTVKGSVVWGD